SATVPLNSTPVCSPTCEKVPTNKREAPKKCVTAGPPSAIIDGGSHDCVESRKTDSRDVRATPRCLGEAPAHSAEHTDRCRADGPATAGRVRPAPRGSRL